MRDGVEIPGTSGACHRILRFVDRNIQPDEIVLAADKRYQDHPYFAWLKLPGMTYDVANDAHLQETFEYTSSQSKALSLGVLCLRNLICLPQSEIDTVFRLFHEYDFEHPRDLLDWGSVLSKFSQKKTAKQMGLVNVRRVFVGSPIYTALK